LRTRPTAVTRPWLWLVAALVALVIIPACISAEGESIGMSVSVSPQTVQRGGQVTYRVLISNGDQTALDGASLSYTLPDAFTYVSGSTQVRSNGVLVATEDPTVTGNVLIWEGLTLPPGRGTAVYGLHSFCQDRCETPYIAYQLDKVKEAMGAGAYVKQLFYRVTETTLGPESCWIDFVNACYDRDLIPVVRLQGVYGGENWNKPGSSGPGDYGAIAQAYARVVAGLPRRDGRLLYVEVWNEPNLDLEWSGAANATEYGEFLVDVASALRAIGDDRIVILNGGLSPGGDIAPLDFIDEMMTVPGALWAFDLWAAHPYPGNHPPEYNIHDGTASSYRDLTIDSYLLELDRLAAWGRRGIQVMITETGYALGQNNFAFQGYAVIDEANRADYVTRALRDYWSRWSEVQGVCPFELVDPLGAWAVWDWLAPDGSSHQQYDAVRAMDKTTPPASGRLCVEFSVLVDAAPGTYSCGAVFTLEDGTSIDQNGVAPLIVQPPPPTPTPTSTPTVTPTPFPTECWDAIRDGGFEIGDGWEIADTAYPASLTQTLSYEGRRSACVGITDGEVVESWSSVRQAFHVPENASSVRIAFMYYPVSEDVGTGLQYALLLDEDKSYLETVMWTVSDARQWIRVEHEASGYAGQTLWIHFGARNTSDASGPTAMYVDQVSVQVCLPLGAVTATPVASLPPGITATPTVGPQCLPLIYRGHTPPQTPSPTPLQSTVTPEPDLPAYVSRTIPVCREPHGIAVDQGTGLVYVASYLDPTLSVIDPGLGEVIATVDLGGVGGSNGVAVDSTRRRVYVVNSQTDNVSVVDLESLTVMGTVTVGDRPLYAAVDESDGTVYVTNHNAGSISVLRGNPPALADVLTTGTEPVHLAVDGARGRLAVVNGSELFDSLSLYGLASGGSAQVVPVGAGPYGLTLDARSGTWYTANVRGWSISVVDASGVPRAEWAMPGPVHQVAYSAATGRVYALCADQGALYMLDAENGQVLLGLSVGAGSGHGIAVDAARLRIYVSNAQDNTVSVICEVATADSLGLPLIWRGASTGQKSVAPLRRSGPRDVEYSVVADQVQPVAPVVTGQDLVLADGETVAYDSMRRRLALAGEGGLTVVDGVSGRTLYSVYMGASVSALAIDPVSGWVWAALAEQGEVRAIGLDGCERVSVSGLGYPSDLEARDGRVYVADTRDNRVIAVEAVTGRVLTSGSLSGSPHAIDVDVGRGRIYVGEMGTGRVLVLDAESLDVLGTVTLGGLAYAHDLTLDASGRHLYVTHDLSPKFGALSVVDTDTLRVLDTMTGDYEEPLTEPRSVFLLRDGAHAVVELGDGFVTVALDGLSVASVTRLDDGNLLRAMAVEPLEGIAYTADSKGHLRTWSLKDATGEAVR